MPPIAIFPLLLDAPEELEEEALARPRAGRAMLPAVLPNVESLLDCEESVSDTMKRRRA